MVRTLSYVFGVVFVILGVWGFFQNPIFGIFDANATHSIVHIISGLIFLGVAMWMPMQASLWMKIIGVVYAIVAILGLVMSGPILGLIDNSTADNILHVVLAIIFLVVGFMPAASSHEMAAPAQM